MPCKYGRVDKSRNSYEPTAQFQLVNEDVKRDSLATISAIWVDGAKRTTALEPWRRTTIWSATGMIGRTSPGIRTAFILL
jgi:hypothetical protein